MEEVQEEDVDLETVLDEMDVSLPLPSSARPLPHPTPGVPPRQWSVDVWLPECPVEGVCGTRRKTEDWGPSPTG